MELNYRKDFPLLANMDVAYLDSAATAQRPQCVLDAEEKFYTTCNANPLRGLYPLSIAATDAYEDGREAVGKFLNAGSAKEIIFTRNTTEGLNLVAYSYGLANVKAGDEVLVYGPGQTERAAQAIGTIVYELLCDLTGRVPRVYVDGPEA